LATPAIELASQKFNQRLFYMGIDSIEDKD